MFPTNIRREGEISHEMARKLPWNKTNLEIALQYNLPIRKVGYWRTKLGVRPVRGSRGPEPIDRSTWEWTLSTAELARRHGMTRQRVHQLRKKFANGVKSPIVQGTALQIYRGRLSKRDGSRV